MPLYFSSSTKSNRKVCLDILIFVSFNKGHVLRLRPIRGLKKNIHPPSFPLKNYARGGGRLVLELGSIYNELNQYHSIWWCQHIMWENQKTINLLGGSKPTFLLHSTPNWKFLHQRRLMDLFCRNILLLLTPGCIYCNILSDRLNEPCVRASRALKFVQMRSKYGIVKEIIVI